MLRHRHRLTRGVDIFVADARVLRPLPAQLRDKTQVEGPGFLRLYLAQGEIDFVASGRITPHAATRERILGREMQVETSAEILAGKIWHRAARFTAADLVDLAVVARHDPAALASLRPVLAARRAALADRLERHQLALRESFAALDLLDFRASFDQCLQAAREILQSAAGDRAEQPRAAYHAGKTRFLGGLALARGR